MRHVLGIDAGGTKTRALLADETGRVLGGGLGDGGAAASSVIGRFGLAKNPYDTVLSGGAFTAVPALAEAVTVLPSAPAATMWLLTDEPAMGAVRLAMEQLG